MHHCAIYASQHRPAANETEDVQITALHTEKGGISLFWLWSNKGTLRRDSSCLSCKRHSMDADDTLLQLQVASTQVHISHPLGTRGAADQGNSNYPATRNPQQLSDSLTVTQETYGKARDFCSPTFELLPQDSASHQWLWLIMQRTGAQHLLHQLRRNLQHLLADLHNQQKQGGGFLPELPWEPTATTTCRIWVGSQPAATGTLRLKRNHRKARHRACVRCGSTSTLKPDKLINK